MLLLFVICFLFLYKHRTNKSVDDGDFFSGNVFNMICDIVGIRLLGNATFSLGGARVAEDTVGLLKIFIN